MGQILSSGAAYGTQEFVVVFDSILSPVSLNPLDLTASCIYSMPSGQRIYFPPLMDLHVLSPHPDVNTKKGKRKEREIMEGTDRLL
jgi:hypothetical protein